MHSFAWLLPLFLSQVGALGVQQRSSGWITSARHVNARTVIFGLRAGEAATAAAIVEDDAADESGADATADGVLDTDSATDHDLAGGEASETEDAADPATGSTGAEEDAAAEAVDADGGNVLESMKEIASDAVKGTEDAFKTLEEDVQRTMVAFPATTRALLSGGCFAVGDGIAQKIVSGKHRFSAKRCLRLSGFGLLASGVLFRLCRSSFRDDGALAGAAVTAVVRRVVIDELILIPMLLLTYFAYVGITAGHAPQEVVEKIEADMPQAMLTSLIVMPALQFLDHNTAAGKTRVLLTAIAMVVYATYLSYVGTKPL